MKAMNGIIRYGCRPQTAFATWNGKFPEEKVCFEDEDYLIHFDGVLLNSTSLKAELGCSDNRQILLALYKAHGAQLVLYAKGLYSLVLWDKQAETVLVTNDLLSKRTLFYHLGGDCLCYGSSYHDLLDILSREGIGCTLDTDAVQDMLRQGFVSGARTYLQEAAYLNAFESLLVDLKARKTQLVHHPLRTVEVPSEEAAVIDRFEALFSAAVALQYEKNIEYGYAQCTTLSGGMDSRAGLLTAEKLGMAENTTCFNYAQSGSLDFSISKEIAVDLGLDYFFYPMDAAVFLGRLQDAMYLNECMQSGIGATGAGTIAKALNTAHFGLIHIGICGGELMGDLVKRNRGSEPAAKLPRLALRIFRKLREELTHPDPKAEDYSFDRSEYLCHLRASQNFAHMFIDKCECVSPFMDEDVVSFVLQLNPGLLYNRRTYRKWMLRYIPNDYIVTSTCAKIDSSMVQELAAKLQYRVLRKRNGVSQWDMNPITHWFEANPHHRENCAHEYESGIRWLKEAGGNDEICALLEAGWQNPWLKRLYVLTALQALKDIHTRFQRIP